MSQVMAVLRWIGRSSRRIAVTVVGASLLGAGAVMLVTPGPGLAAIVLGLAVLGTEYAWARRALEKARERARRTGVRLRRRATRKRTQEKEGAG